MARTFPDTRTLAHCSSGPQNLSAAVGVGSSVAGRGCQRRHRVALLCTFQRARIWDNIHATSEHPPSPEILAQQNVEGDVHALSCCLYSEKVAVTVGPWWAMPPGSCDPFTPGLDFVLHFLLRGGLLARSLRARRHRATIITPKISGTYRSGSRVCTRTNLLGARRLRQQRASRCEQLLRRLGRRVPAMGIRVLTSLHGNGGGFAERADFYNRGLGSRNRRWATGFTENETRLARNLRRILPDTPSQKILRGRVVGNVRAIISVDAAASICCRGQ